MNARDVVHSPNRFKRHRSPSPITQPRNLSPRKLDAPDDLESEDVDHCSICLQAFRDRSVLPKCAHEFCFECISIWTGESAYLLVDVEFITHYLDVEQSRRCPLCTQAVGDHLVHYIRSRDDFERFFLPPLRTSPAPLNTLVGHPWSNRPRRQRTRAERDEHRRNRERVREREEADMLERAITRRKWIYEHGLYAKVWLHTTDIPMTKVA